MGFAAIPAYLRPEILKEASPGLRFSMYLPIWGENRSTRERLWTLSDVDVKVPGPRREERPVPHVNKRSALEGATALTSDDQKRNKALRIRQTEVAMAQMLRGDLLCVQGRSTAPFTTGLGNEHPLENGFSFLNPYGLPYLPGSSVKGVMRAAARELSWNATLIELLFGTATDRDEERRRGVLCFWDVFPEIRADRLLVEVMTPHQSHYYAPQTDGRNAMSDSPHDSGDPNPIFFLTVPPGSLFTFHVQCDFGLLGSIAASRRRGAGEIQDYATQLREHSQRWKESLGEAFDHAFSWLGFGAKTAVGYGSLERNPQEQSDLDMRIQRQREQEAAEAARAGKSAAQLRIADFVAWCQERAKSGSKTRIGAQDYQEAQRLAEQAAGSDWSAAEKAEAANAIELWGPQVIATDKKDLRKRLKLATLKGNQ